MIQQQTLRSVSGRGEGLATHRRRALMALVLWANVWLFTGCSTGAKLETSENHSLNYIRYVINQTSPRGVRGASTNQREVYSNYFTPDSFTVDGTEKRERAFAIFYVLGASRPYTIEVQVRKEKRDGAKYKSNGTDKKRAKVLANRLADALAKSREDTNFVDDWRPF